MAPGDHIKVYHGIYTHHGIDCGDGTVIHYKGGLDQKINAVISRTAKRIFSSGREIFVVNYKECLPPESVMKLAYSRLNENNYHLLFNNCEHFAMYCKTGQFENNLIDLGVVKLGDAAIVAVKNPATAIGDVVNGVVCFGVKNLTSQATEISNVAITNTTNTTEDIKQGVVESIDRCSNAIEEVKTVARETVNTVEVSLKNWLNF